MKTLEELLKIVADTLDEKEIGNETIIKQIRAGYFVAGTPEFGFVCGVLSACRAIVEQQEREAEEGLW